MQQPKPGLALVLVIAACGDGGAVMTEGTGSATTGGEATGSPTGASTGSEGTTGTEPAPALPVEAPALPVEAPAPDPVAAPPIAAAPSAAPVAAPPVIPPPPGPEPAEPLEDVSEDMVEETAPASDPLWPMGAAIAGGLALVAVIALARRPRATT